MTEFGVISGNKTPPLSYFGVDIMPPLIDISGQKFGRLIVIKRDTSRIGKYVYWICQCECGNIKSIRGTALKDGLTKSCGCLSVENKSTFKIKQYGKLLPLKIVDMKDDKHKYWECQCECGNKTITRQDYLLSGHTTSCGCIKSKGEMLIQKILTEQDIDFKTQFTFSDLKNKSKLRFDFAIFKNDNLFCLLEFQGKQHYKFNEQGWNNKQHFENQQITDNLKRQYCINNNIKLIEIPYYDIDKLSWEYLNDKFDFTQKV